MCFIWRKVEGEIGKRGLQVVEIGDEDRAGREWRWVETSERERKEKVRQA